MKKTNYKRHLTLLLVFLILSNSGIPTYAAEQTSDPDTTITATDTDQSSDSLEMDSIGGYREYRCILRNSGR